MKEGDDVAEKFNIIKTDSGALLYVPLKEEDREEKMKQEMNYNNFIKVLSEIIVKYT